MSSNDPPILVPDLQRTSSDELSISDLDVLAAEGMSGASQESDAAKMQHGVKKDVENDKNKEAWDSSTWAHNSVNSELSISDLDVGAAEGMQSASQESNVGVDAAEMQHGVKKDVEKDQNKKAWNSSTWAHNGVDSSSSEDEVSSQSTRSGVDSERMREFREQRRMYLQERGYQRSYSDPSLDVAAPEDTPGTQDESDSSSSRQRSRTATWTGTELLPTLAHTNQEQVTEVVELEQQSGARRRSGRFTPERMNRIVVSPQLVSSHVKPKTFPTTSKFSRISTLTPFRLITILFFVAVYCTAFLDVRQQTSPTYNLVDDAFDERSAAAVTSVGSTTMKGNSLLSRNLQGMSTQQDNKKKSTTSASYTEQARLRGVAPIGVSFGRKSDKVVFTYDKNKSNNQEVKQQEDKSKSETEQNRINLKRKEVEQFFQQEAFTDFTIPWYVNGVILLIIAIWAVHEQYRKGLTLCD